MYGGEKNDSSVVIRICYAFRMEVGKYRNLGKRIKHGFLGGHNDGTTVAVADNFLF